MDRLDLLIDLKNGRPWWKVIECDHDQCLLLAVSVWPSIQWNMSFVCFGVVDPIAVSGIRATSSTIGYPYGGAFG